MDLLGSILNTMNETKKPDTKQKVKKVDPLAALRAKAEAKKKNASASFREKAIIKIRESICKPDGKAYFAMCNEIERSIVHECSDTFDCVCEEDATQIDRETNRQSLYVYKSKTTAAERQAIEEAKQKKLREEATIEHRERMAKLDAIADEQRKKKRKNMVAESMGEHAIAVQPRAKIVVSINNDDDDNKDITSSSSIRKQKIV